MIKTLNNDWYFIERMRKMRMEREMENEKWQREVSRLVEYYKEMESVVPGSGMLREVRWQYLEMASGRSGGDLGFEEKGETTCRGINYPEYPDWVFQEVVDQMGWNE